MIKLILSWIIIVAIFLFLTADKGIYYSEPILSECNSDYIGSCN